MLKKIIEPFKYGIETNLKVGYLLALIGLSIFSFVFGLVLLSGFGIIKGVGYLGLLFFASAMSICVAVVVGCWKIRLWR